MTWEGLNAPVQMTKDMDRDGDQDQGRDRGRERWDKQRNEGPKPGQRSFQRGWSGTTWPGRKIGPPETPDGGWCLSTCIYHLFLLMWRLRPDTFASTSLCLALPDAPPSSHSIQTSFSFPSLPFSYTDAFASCSLKYSLPRGFH